MKGISFKVANANDPVWQIPGYGPDDTPFSGEKQSGRTIGGLIQDWLCYRGEFWPGVKYPDYARFEDPDRAEELQIQLHRVLVEKYPGARFEVEGAQIWADRNTMFGMVNVEFLSAINPNDEPELWPAY